MRTLIGGDYQKEMIKCIDSAVREIDIVTYDWRWYENQPQHPVQQFNLALLRAVKRGVQVRAVLNDDLLLNRLTTLGIRARVLNDRRVLHSKIIIFDRSLLAIGSHNLTRNAFTTNIESSVLVYIPDGETRILEFFDNLYNL